MWVNILCVEVDPQEKRIRCMNALIENHLKKKKKQNDALAIVASLCTNIHIVELFKKWLVIYIMKWIVVMFMWET